MTYAPTPKAGVSGARLGTAAHSVTPSTTPSAAPANRTAGGGFSGLPGLPGRLKRETPPGIGLGGASRESHDGYDPSSSPAVDNCQADAMASSGQDATKPYSLARTPGAGGFSVAGNLSTGHNAERPLGGALANCFGSASWERSRNRMSWQTCVSHKSPKGATGEFVLMPKRITSGIESSPMDRRPVDRVAFRVVQPGIRYTPNGLKALNTDLGGAGESPPPVNVPWWKRNDDLTGMTIGQLVVVRYLGDKVDKDGGTKHSRWLVRCHCGEYEHRRGASLRKLASLVDHPADRCWECQNLRKLRGGDPKQTDSWQDTPIPTSSLDSSALGAFVGGERFGRLTVIGYGRSSGKTGARWVARCDCGAYGLVSAAGLKRGKSPQCSRCYRASGCRP